MSSLYDILTFKYAFFLQIIYLFLVWSRLLCLHIDETKAVWKCLKSSKSPLFNVDRIKDFAPASHLSRTKINVSKNLELKLSVHLNLNCTI